MASLSFGYTPSNAYSLQPTNVSSALGTTSNANSLNFGNFGMLNLDGSTSGATGMGSNLLNNQNLNFGFNPYTANADTSTLGNFSNTDFLNFGLGAAQLGLGAYYQNKAIDQQQQSLDLARDKYNQYLSEQKSLDTAYNNWGK